ncbi:MAG: LysR family transcriptional regulator [Solirubrobacteraceae bacterium]
MLDSRRLRVLVEVARRGSFSAAAEALGYTQPAISRQIAALEGEVGMVLVRRVPQGAVLTDAGRLLADRAEAILARLQDAEAELRSLAGLEGGTLKLATFASAAASIVPLAVVRFRSRHPQVDLQVTVAEHDKLARLRSGDHDLALTHDPGNDLEGVATAADFETIALFDDPMYVALPLGHPLADAPALSMGDLSEEPWMLSTGRTCPDWRLFMRACHDAGFEPKIAFQNDDYPAILGFVAAGVGVALIPDMVTRRVRDDVVIRELEPPPPPRPISALVPAGYRSPAAAVMLDVLVEVSAEWVSSRPKVSAVPLYAVEGSRP